jgi:hypothetical protein
MLTECENSKEVRLMTDVIVFAQVMLTSEYSLVNITFTGYVLVNMTSNKWVTNINEVGIL